jgi:protein-ribulosamine 3-kinase
MLNGEWESSQIFHKLDAALIPKPYACERYKTDQDGLSKHFLLCEFVNIITYNKIPLPLADKHHEALLEFCRNLAFAHKQSQSPNGMFGFHVPTCDGGTVQVVKWHDNWSNFYHDLIDGLHKKDLDANKDWNWPEMKIACQQIPQQVIPILLGPLQKEGLTLKPSILHGDLWEGNIGYEEDTGSKKSKAILFDAGSFYGHNELEFGHWRSGFGEVLRDKQYIDAYLEVYPAAEPKKDFDDRIRLYTLNSLLNYSSGAPGTEMGRVAREA